MKKLAALIVGAALMASVSVSASTETEMISYENAGIDLAKTAELQTKEGVLTLKASERLMEIITYTCSLVCISPQRGICTKPL